MTGSNRDRLASLVRDRKQAFFGSRVTDFLLLGRDYTDAYTAYVNDALKEGRSLDPDEVWAAFVIVGHRPQLLEAAVADHVLGTVGPQSSPTSLSRTVWFLPHHPAHLDGKRSRVAWENPRNSA